jgi:thioredoxin reductase (NADPH)
MQTATVVIIGSGPAGYSAAIYNSRALLEPVLFGGLNSGGQLMSTTEVENYAGFPKGVMGPDLMIGMRQQAERFGTTVRDEYVTAVDLSERPFKIWTAFPQGFDPQQFPKLKPDEIEEFTAKVRQENEPVLLAESLIIATGAAPITLGIPGESELWARGVSSCAVCDAPFFRDKKVFVVGGGDSAMEDSLALSRFASEVHMLHRRDEFKASKIMQKRVLENEKITVHWNTTLNEILGDNKVEKVKVTENGQEKEYDAGGVFLAIGHRPMNLIFVGQLEMDDKGYVVTRQSGTKQGVEMAQKALSDEGILQSPTMTSVEGVFASGDGVDVRYKQAVTAAGQGCAAALDAEHWLENQE